MIPLIFLWTCHKKFEVTVTKCPLTLIPIKKQMNMYYAVNVALVYFCLIMFLLMLLNYILKYFKELPSLDSRTTRVNPRMNTYKRGRNSKY